MEQDGKNNKIWGNEMKKIKWFFENTWKHRAHVVMSLPAFLILLVIMYVPMIGLTLAFKDYSTAAGLFKSPWCTNADGQLDLLKNVKFLLVSKDTFWAMTRNTVMYYLIFTVVGTILNVVLAISIDQFVFKRAAKVMQTIMIVPVFISYAAVTFIVYAFLDRTTGIINNMTGNMIPWYTSPQHWPLILTIVKIWNGVGYGSVLYMSVLAGIDTSLYEAAEIDGANKWQQIIHVTLPSLIPMITVMLLLSVGNVMKSDTGLFYQVTKNGAALQSTTRVIDSYILNALRTTPNYGFTAAASLFQSIVGLLLMLFANFTVKKIEPENALF